jgi:hypothetical protein
MQRFLMQHTQQRIIIQRTRGEAARCLVWALSSSSTAAAVATDACASHHHQRTRWECTQLDQIAKDSNSAAAYTTNACTGKHGNFIDSEVARRLPHHVACLLMCVTCYTC